MDPLSIAVSAATLAQALIKVSNYLDSFIRAAKKVNQTVISLRVEVQSLQAVVLLIEQAVKNPVLQRAANIDSSLDVWPSVQANIESSQTTSVALGLLLDQYNGKRGFWNSATSQWRMNSMREDIANHRLHVAAHMACLQVSLQMINM